MRPCSSSRLRSLQDSSQERREQVASDSGRERDNGAEPPPNLRSSVVGPVDCQQEWGGAINGVSARPPLELGWGQLARGRDIGVACGVVECGHNIRALVEGEDEIVTPGDK